MKPRENKRDFCLGGTQEKGEEQRAAAFEKTQREYVQEQRKRKPHKKQKEERAVKREPLREKRRQPRESCAWRRK